ncbi:MAG: hypothetical protein M1812_006723 [Candelaria pacifica]|nr:MAG: hypothetical protein M1812_006723 [Candelaria pacifica]
MAAVSIIGVVGTLITAVGFIQAQFPKSADNDAQVRIAVGLDHGGLQDAGGEEPYTVSVTPWALMKSANKLALIGTGGGMQVTTLESNAAPNGICIAYISLTWSDGQRYGWLGDVGKACGHSWYASEINVDPEGDGDENKPPY